MKFLSFHKKSQEGAIQVLILVVIALIIVGFIILRSKNSNPPTQPVQNQEQQNKTSLSIAGKSSFYKEFTKKEYDEALISGKLVLLNFYANWCPVCRAEAPEFEEGFNSLTTDGVIGFRVNYSDSDTDGDEKALAQEFKITYQHTKIILKDGKEVSRSMEQWDKAIFLQELGRYGVE